MKFIQQRLSLINSVKGYTVFRIAIQNGPVIKLNSQIALMSSPFKGISYIYSNVLQFYVNKALNSPAIQLIKYIDIECVTLLSFPEVPLGPLCGIQHISRFRWSI